mgnify:FL=1|jgi:GTP-binding protein LepA
MLDRLSIRNFCIIAHVDHGKTTLSDRLLELTRTVTARDMKEQMLDSMDLERERGITIKSHPVSMVYNDGGREYLFNLMDTPGHVDFSYEVSRSLAACEGALLLVDAAQGIEAQTVANAHLAVAQGLEVIPVINKVDLPSAEPERIQDQIEEVLAIPREETILASAKSGIGIDAVLRAVIDRIPPPAEPPAGIGTRGLVFDCVYNPYKGVITYVRMFSGEVRRGETVSFVGSEVSSQVKEVGRFSPQMVPEESLETGTVGYVVTGIRDVAEVKLGDTLTRRDDPAREMLPGYQEVRPMVFSGLYPLDTSDYEKLKASLGKLRLNDAAFVYQSESSAALGFGFRCGFLGLLHMEIVQERLRREYGLDILSTYPSVIYRVKKTDGTFLEVDNPVFFPPQTELEWVEEPMIEATIHTPNSGIGDLLALISEKRGLVEGTETLDSQRVMIRAILPLNEILVDFNDRLKSLTHGYGSMDYEPKGHQVADLVRLEILVNEEPIEAFSSIVHRSKAEGRGRALCEKLKDLLPRQLFRIPIQAAVDSRIVARETISPMRKDVTAKCYGGDISRKRKLLEKQKEGKKRMKQIGSVSIPQEAFVQVLKSSQG